jgi:hypothetical protein
MKLAFHGLTFALAFLATACGTSSTTVTGPSLDRCAITVANSMSSVGASGGTGRLTVTAGRECTWSVTSNVPWITPRPPAGGQGDGTIDYVVAANPSTEARRGTVTMGGQVLEVVQEGVSCRFDLQPTSQNMGAEGGSGSFTVDAPSGCNWTPAASHDWITITNGGSRSGNGSVNFTVAPNTAGVRDGTINVGGQAFAILQAAPSCRYQLSAITGSFGGAGGSGTVNVTAASACAWTATTNVPWVSIAGDVSGSGNGTVSFTVQANTGPARNGILTIGGQRFTVTQQQAQCSYSISPAGQAFTAAGGQGTVTVSTNSVCTWNTSDVPAWVTGMPASGTGTRAIAFTVDANPGPERSVAVIIGGQNFAVSQAAGCSYSLAPGSHNSSAGGGASSFAVNTAAGCGWTSSGVPAWITGVPASGTGPQAVNFTVAANTGGARNANIIVGGKTFTVTQAAVACSYSLNPTSHSATAAGGSGMFDVNTTASCSWTSSGVPAWITPWGPASGTGTTTISFTVTANPDPTPRNANITIGGQTFAVTQAAAAAVCSYSLNPTSHSAAAAGGSSMFDVNTTAGCAWTSSGVPAWITGVPENGTGTQTINFTVAANPDPTSRNANIVIGGQTFAVTQAAAAAACSYSLNPTSHSATAAGGSSMFDVNTTASCSWTSSGVPAWITPWGPASGTGTTTISFTVTANPDPTPRSANITIGGQTFAVTQAAAAAPCSYSLNPTSYSAAAAGASSTFDLNTAAGCAWTSTAPAWITVPANGTGPTTINFTVAANTGPARNANIVIEGQTFAVSQANGCTYAVAPGSLTFSAAGTPPQEVTLTTQAGCNWTAAPSDSWITIVSGGAGPSSGTIRIELQTHTGPAARTGNISVGGETVTITQNP